MKIGYFALGDNYDDTVTSYFRCWYYFGMYGKKRPLAILWYQLDVPGGLNSSLQVVVTTPPPSKDLLEKSLVRRGLT